MKSPKTLRRSPRGFAKITRHRTISYATTSTRAGRKYPPSREALDKLQRACVVDRGGETPSRGRRRRFERRQSGSRRSSMSPRRFCSLREIVLIPRRSCPMISRWPRSSISTPRRRKKFYAGMTAAVASSDLAGASDGRLLHVTGTHRCGDVRALVLKFVGHGEHVHGVRRNRAKRRALVP